MATPWRLQARAFFFSAANFACSAGDLQGPAGHLQARQLIWNAARPKFHCSPADLALLGRPSCALPGKTVARSLADNCHCSGQNFAAPRPGCHAPRLNLSRSTKPSSSAPRRKISMLPERIFHGRQPGFGASRTVFMLPDRLSALRAVEAGVSPAKPNTAADTAATTLPTNLSISRRAARGESGHSLGLEVIPGAR